MNGFISDNLVIGESVFLTDAEQGLTVKDIVDDILQTWGLIIPELVFRHHLKRAMHDMNGAFQMIWAMAKDADYFSRKTLTLSFGSGVGQVILPGNVLGVLGPARYLSTGQSLRPLSSRGMLDNFGPAFLGLSTFAVPNGTPLAFFIEKLNIAMPDNVQNVMHIVPAPSVDMDILQDVSVQCPRYDWNDYVNATPVEMPNKYADAVLIPFARYRAMSSQYFVDSDRRPTIEADYQTALRLIGAVDPSMKEVTYAEHASDRSR